jgi:hypothetical protein
MIALLLATLFQSTAPVSAAVPSTPPAKVAQAKPACRKETVVGTTIKKKICPRKVEEVAQADDAEAPQVLQVASDAASPK